MVGEATSDVTLLLNDYRAGDRGALDKLIPLLYDELHRIAARCVAGDRQMQPTSLIHEAYLRLAGRAPAAVEGRLHFYMLAAQVMRQVLVDRARARMRQKRGAGAGFVTFNEEFMKASARPDQLVALDDALNTLKQMDERKARIVELRFFGGLSLEEVSEALGISPSTAGREMRTAKAWLFGQLGLSQTTGG